jgi:RND family efflux transporter MFP subunit
MDVSTVQENQSKPAITQSNSVVRRMVTWCVIFACLAGAGAAVARVMPNKGAKSATTQAETLAAGPAPIVITVDTITSRAVRRTIDVVGSLYGWEELGIVPRVEGRVVTVKRDVGDVVKPGDVLFTIDQTDHQLATDEQQRGMEMELAKIGLAALPSSGFEVDTLPTVVKALAERKNAAARSERIVSLQTSISKDESDKAAMELTVADAAVKQARLDALATLATARHRSAMLATAKQKLNDTTVVVPNVSVPPGTVCEFTIAQRMVSEGEVVRPGGTIAFKLVLPRTLKMQVSVPERYLAEVAVGQRVELDVEAYRERVFAGTIGRVNPSVDRSTRMFQVEVHVPNADGKLRPGSFAKARLIARAADEVMTVPEEAIHHFAGVVKLFVMDGDRVRAVPITTGTSVSVNDGKTPRIWVEVIGEVRAGDRIATSGLLKLADKSIVRVR